MQRTYTAALERDDDYWLVRVPEIGQATQARQLWEVEHMARDLISITEKISDPESFTLRIEWPTGVQLPTVRLRVWHIPQIPGRPFHVPVPDIDTALLVVDALADYDLFQLANRIKPDYANMGGVQYFDHREGEWLDLDVDDPETLDEQLRDIGLPTR